MMQWMFQNLATGTAVSPVDGKTYPMFLLFHPRDHCAHNNSMTPLPAKSGSYNRFVEFPLTGCSETSSGTTWNFSCATRGQDNPGFTRNTSAEVWNASSLEKNNGNPRYTSLGSNKVEFSTRRCNDRGQCAYTVKTLQSWSYNKKTGALTVTSKLLIGLTWYAGSNTRIINTWADGLDPYHKFYRAAMHYTEEYSTLPGWLPDAYNKANPPKGR
ncbi:hypothetical protein MNEG_6462 [Monoraphidium neglectum]|uniref:Uncharacterized protein n=1 Tax=Monoraphidium neglectum TaxID=145388 RepID=A0A0D2MLR2_9CHLO|nr:hypothetical protein MNEG_6462 [Monoraphidium neglectum]KIZ01497.1 hypothetical protein MNEG_6462 [Monoraphidium neglectum]|eukprot:XP_013900516.1 hypothetical protein MNEG_6462 [Monoraphidium neglectum]